MRSYMVKLPRGVEVDIFDLPEDFGEQIKESFKGYTAETAKEYRYCDKLGYIDCCIKYLNGGKRSGDIVNEMVEGRILYEWRENGKSLRKMIFTAVSLWKIAMTEEKKMQGCVLILEVMTTTFMTRFRKCL